MLGSSPIRSSVAVFLIPIPDMITRTATVKVKKVTKLKNVKYQVRYGTSKKLKKYKTKTFKRNKFTLTKLKANKKYYVKVRAYVVTKNKKKVYGTWSKTKPIKVKKK